MIANGAIFTYVGTWTRETLSSADSTVTDISSALTNAGLPLRGAPKVDASLFSSLPFASGQFQVTFQAQVENGMGFNTVDDIITAVRNAVYQATGKFPVSDSVPQYQDNSSAPPVQTGLPKGSSGTPQCIAGGSSDTTGSFSISCWWQNLTTKGLSTVGILALLIVAGFGIFIYYGPQRVRITQ